MTIEVQVAPDLSNHSKVGGVRLIVPPHVGVLDLSTAEAHKLVEDILAALFSTGAMRGTI